VTRLMSDAPRLLFNNVLLVHSDASALKCSSYKYSISSAVLPLVVAPFEALVVQCNSILRAVL
jgi:hypothetical protein